MREGIRDGIASAASDEAGRAFLEALEKRDHLCRLFEDLVEAASDGVIALDFRGEVAHVSQSLAGKGSPDGSGGDREAVPPAVLELLRRNAAEAVPGRTHRFSLDWEHAGEGTDGNRRHYDVAASAGIFPSKEFGQDRAVTLFAFRDRTRERELERLAARSSELVSVGQMAATIAHEVRNPLGAIHGFASLLQQDLAGQDRPLRLVEKILGGVARADGVITSVLEFSRPVEIRAVPLDAASMLEESLLGLRLSPKWRDEIELDTHLDPDLPMCSGDRRLLLQVLANLYRNAIEAMEGSGTLSIRVRPAEGACGGSPEGCRGGDRGGSGEAGRIRIVVRDTGCGMTAEQVSRVFEPFYSTKPAGTGLGLALVQKIVEAHGGRIHMVSAPERGTSVVLDLPACESAGSDTFDEEPAVLSGEEAA